MIVRNQGNQTNRTKSVAGTSGEDSHSIVAARLPMSVHGGWTQATKVRRASAVVNSALPRVSAIGGALAVSALAGIVSAVDAPKLVSVFTVISLGILGLATLPTSAMLFVLGFLLPIHQIAGVPVLMLDLARYALAFGLILKFRPNPRRRTLRPYEIALIIAALWIVTLALGRSDPLSLTTGGVMVVSTIIAWMLWSRGLVAKPLWIGFVTAAALNSIIVILQSIGINLPITPDRFAGYGRHIGLAANAPLLSFELAVAAVLAFLISGTVTRIAAQSLVLVGLLMCGGRGGLVALAAALFVVLAFSQRHRKVALALTSMGAIVGLGLLTTSTTLATVDRFIQASATSTDSSSGRVALLESGLREFLNAPMFGLGLSSFVDKYGTTPHVAILSFAIAGGVVPAICVAFVLGTVLRGAWHERGNTTVALPSITIFAVWIILEPTGPLVGLLGLLLLAYVAPHSDQENDSHCPIRDLKCRSGGPDVTSSISPAGESYVPKQLSTARARGLSRETVAGSTPETRSHPPSGDHGRTLDDIR